MPFSLKNFFVKFVSVVEKGDNPGADVVMFKNKKKEGGGGMKTFEELIKELSDEDVKIVEKEIEDKDTKFKDLEKIKKDLEKTNKDLEKNQKEPDVKKEEKKDKDLLKSADPEIKEMIKKLEKDVKDNKEEADKLKKENEEKEKELRKEALSKEADKFGNIGATKEDLVEIFTKVAETGDKELMEKIKAVLSADNTALEGNALIKSVGSDKDPEDKTAVEEIAEKAQELMKSDKKLTKEQAKAKVMKDDPKLYKKYLEE